MQLTDKQIKEMLDAAKPLIKWMNENCNPHCVALVDCTTVELTSGVATARTTEFLKDFYAK